jgi:DNA-directed RNA polymerase specialized sigma24 family protein
VRKKGLPETEKENLRWQAALASNDEVTIESMLAELKRSIEKIVRRYQNSPGDISGLEARDNAIAKVKEFLVTIDFDHAKTIGNFRNYLLTIAHNAVNDYFLRKERDVYGVELKFSESKYEEEEDVALGFSSLRLPERGTKSLLEKQETNKANFLEQTFYSLFWDVDGTPHETLQEVGRNADELVTTMPDTFPSAKKIMTLYFLGYKQVDIVGKLGIEKSNVSRALKYWREAWHWEESDMEKARLCLLFHRLADIGLEISSKQEKSRQGRPIDRHYERGMSQEKSQLWLKIKPGGDLSCELGMPSLKQQIPEMRREPLERPRFGFHVNESELYRDHSALKRVQSKVQKEIARNESLYNAVVNDERTKAWRHLFPEDKANLCSFIDWLAGFHWGLDERYKEISALDNHYWEDYEGEISDPGEEPDYLEIHSKHELC